MGIQKWSDEITVVELFDSPQFADDVSALTEELDDGPCDIVLNFAGVDFINSSDVSKLLRLRKKMLTLRRRLMLCDVTGPVFGVLKTTGLDKMFDFAGDVATALATVQLAGPVEAEDQEEGKTAHFPRGRGRPSLRIRYAW